MGDLPQMDIQMEKAKAKGRRKKEVSCDAYVQIDCDDLDTMDIEIVKTKVITSLNPAWRERHELPGFTYKQGTSLTLLVYDHDKDDMDDLVGKVFVPVPTLGGSSKEQAYPIMTED